MGYKSYFDAQEAEEEKMAAHFVQGLPLTLTLALTLTLSRSFLSCIVLDVNSHLPSFLPHKPASKVIIIHKTAAKLLAFQ
jgi:hypothetical protein